MLSAKPRHFHTVDEGAGASGWSSGSIAMALLAVFAMLLVVAAFVLRAAQPAQGRR